MSDISITQYHYIYLLQEREFIKSNEPIYKIGKTTRTGLTRFSNYPNGSDLLFHIKCNDCHSYEKLLIQLFKSKYTLRKEIGNEYFQGNYKHMIRDIFYFIDNNDFFTINPASQTQVTSHNDIMSIDTSLDTAIIQSNFTLITLLHKMKHPFPDNLMDIAISNANLPLVKCLHQLGLSPLSNTIPISSILTPSQHDVNNNMPLIHYLHSIGLLFPPDVMEYAIIHGNLQLIHFLISIAINIPDNAMLLACSHNHIHLVKLFYTFDYKPHQTIISNIVYHGHLDILKLFYLKDTTLAQYYPESLILFANHYGHTHIASFIKDNYELFIHSILSTFIQQRIHFNPDSFLNMSQIFNAFRFWFHDYKSLFTFRHLSFKEIRIYFQSKFKTTLNPHRFSGISLDTT